MKKLFADFVKGLWKENPVLVLLLGTCPTLATTSSAVNGFAMGIATTCVLCGSNLVISLIANIVPQKIRIPVYIVVIATFVSVLDMVMKAYAPPAVYGALGIFIPLIVVNCIVLGRAEAFASKNGVIKSAIDGIGMGLGFTVALSLISAVREILGNGTILDIPLGISSPAIVMILPPGGFLTLGILLGLINVIKNRKGER